MSLREAFDNMDAATSRQGHRDDHAAIHRRLNSVVFADDYPSIQAALDDCAARKLRTVLLNASKTYPITNTLNIPAGLTLDGNYATIRAEAAMDVMVTMTTRSTVTRCEFNGGGALAAGGVFLRSTGERLIDNRFGNFTNPDSVAVKAGGALYTWLEHNYVLNIAGRGLDALHIHNPVGYYGMNVFTSIGNAWGGKMGNRVEGFGQMRGDAFEAVVDGPSMLQIGNTFQSHIALDGLYFELKLGTADELVAIRVNDSSMATIRDCQIWGETGKPGAAVDCNCYGINMTGCRIGRWETGVRGQVAYRMPVVVAGNLYLATPTPINLNTSAARIVLLEDPPNIP